MKKVITNTLKNYVVKLYTESNLSLLEMSNILDISVSAIHKILAAENVPTRLEERLKKVDVERAISMYEQGYYLENIYEETNINSVHLYQELDKRSIPRRHVRAKRTLPPKESVYTKDVISLYEEGKTSAEIARVLVISQGTVTRILEKALENGTITIRPSDVMKEKENARTDDVAKLYVFMKENKNVCIRDVAKVMNLNEQRLYRLIRMHKSRKGKC